MKWINILPIFFFAKCHSLGTLYLSEIKNNSINEFSSEIMQNSIEEKTVIDKNWLYPVKAKQAEGRKFERFLSELAYEQMDSWFKQLRLLLIEPLEKQLNLKNFDKKSFELLNDTLLNLSTLQDKLVLMRDFNILSFLSSFISEINELENEINSGRKEDELLSRIHHIFEDLCRKHHKILLKLGIDNTDNEATDVKKTKKM